jgi:2-dehydro-3-deoxyphosphogluconate aldolase/(4S)-4-hydroxy-2-oxoglutarate aldolase
MNVQEFLAQYRAARASAILRTHDQTLAREAMSAAIAGGFRVIEFTLSIPGANELIAEFSQRAGLIVGAGTVLTVDEARAAAQAGASFLVSPVVDELVLEEAHRLGLPVMPGCATPTEMLRAYRAGAQLQKLFPAPGTGPAWVKQTLGPMPFLKIVPTSGVTLENAAAFWQAGAYALGFVASLFPDADLTAHRFDLIQARAQEMLAAVGRA